MKFFIFTLLLTAGVWGKSSPQYEKNKLFIKLKEGRELPQSKLILSAKLLFGQNYLATTSDAEALGQELSEHPAVQSTQKSYYSQKKRLPEAVPLKNLPLPEFFGAFNDPRADRVWSFNDASKNGVSVNAAYMNPLNIQKEEIIVAVADTGVDYLHEDLKEVMWVNPNEIPGNGIDDDENGYIDDVYGINPIDGNSDPMDSHSHGTHVAGTIGAAQNNGVGIAGIASKVRIMALRTVPNHGDETDANVVESFLYAARNGARIINCSFGKRHNEGGMIVNETMDYIGKTYGALVIAAAGNDYGSDNDRSPRYPASFPSDYLMVVASTASAGGLSWFSNVGAKTVDVAAPGSNIYSTTPGNRYASMSGTSMASPTAAGVAAEVLSHFPEFDPISLKKVLMDTVTKSSRYSGKMVSGGRVDLLNALNHALENYDHILQSQK